jgi:hypothetical protein
MSRFGVTPRGVGAFGTEVSSSREPWSTSLLRRRNCASSLSFPPDHDRPLTPIDYVRHPRPCAPVGPRPAPRCSSRISWADGDVLHTPACRPERNGPCSRTGGERCHRWVRGGRPSIGNGRTPVGRSHGYGPQNSRTASGPCGRGRAGRVSRRYGRALAPAGEGRHGQRKEDRCDGGESSKG